MILPLLGSGGEPKRITRNYAFTRSDLMLTSNDWSSFIVAIISRMSGQLESSDLKVRRTAEERLKRELSFCTHLGDEEEDFETPDTTFLTVLFVKLPEICLAGVALARAASFCNKECSYVNFIVTLSFQNQANRARSDVLIPLRRHLRHPA